MVRALAAAFLIATATLAAAAPSTISDCEKIADPDAYNRCLASFGPAMKTGRFTQAPPPSAQEMKAAPPQHNTPVARGRSRARPSFVRTRHGRVRMTIDFGRSRGKATRRSRRR